MPLTPDGVRFIAVHCSATSPKVKVNAAVIDRWHRERGFRKIGYHFVINRDGSVEKGRDQYEIGAHVEGWNAVSVGVCLVGGVDEKNNPQDNFTNAQCTALERVVKRLLNVFPKAVVQGHRDFPNVRKACPSFDVKAWWQGANIH